MGTCATCHWWREANPKPSHTHLRAEDVCAPLDPDTYEPIPPVFPLRFCWHPMVCMNERPPEPSWVVVIDASDYYAALLTGPDFGCVHHERSTG
jgi:hypothetical protein